MLDYLYMRLNPRKILNFEVPKEFEPLIQDQLEKLFLRTLNGLEVLIKQDISSPPLIRKKLLYQEKNLTLYHYIPVCERVHEIPIVLVPPLMTTTDIFDLTPEHSLAGTLVEQGYNVYLVDFGKPDRSDSHLKIDDYVLNYLYRAVHMTKKHADSSQVTLLGYCLGGSFSIVYGSVSLDIRNDVKNVINIAGPIDMKHLQFFNYVFKPFKKEWFALIDKFNGIPKEFLTFIFKVSDPISHIRRPLHIVEKSWDRDFLVKYQALNNFFSNFQMLPAAAFKQCFEIIAGNQLVAGKYKMMDQTIDFSNFQANLLAFGGSKDTFIPPDSVRGIKEHISSKEFQYIELPFGHVSIMGSDKAQNSVWRTIIEWLKDKSGQMIRKDAIDRVATSA